jgi:hypothetical protein
MPLDSFCAIYNREENSLALYTEIKKGVATHCILLSREPLDSFCAIYNREENSLALYTGIKKGVATHCILLSREPYILALLRGGMALLRGGCNVLPLLFLFLHLPLIQDFYCAFANPCMM